MWISNEIRTVHALVMYIQYYDLKILCACLFFQEK